MTLHYPRWQSSLRRPLLTINDRSSDLLSLGGIVEFYILKGGDASSGLDGAFQLQQKILDWYGEPLDVSGDPGPDMIITQATTDTFASTKAGWLKKQGAEKKNWKKRWFVLDIDALRYFESASQDFCRTPL